MSVTSVTIRLEVQSAVRKMPEIMARIDQLRSLVPDWNSYEADQIEEKIQDLLAGLIGTRTIKGEE